MSSIIPSAIIAINSNISNNVLNTIKHQLNINDVSSLEEYESNLLLDDSYAQNYLLSNKRLLILYSNNSDLQNLQINVICRIQNGLICILDKMEPKQTFKIVNLSWDKLNILNYNRS